MVANGNSRGAASDDDVPMTSLGNDVTNGHGSPITLLNCPHCNFHCISPTAMTQHSWEEHPLLMRRKKHLITSSKTDYSTSSKNADRMQKMTHSSNVKSPPPVNETAQEMKDFSISGSERKEEIPVEQGTPQTQQDNSSNLTWSYRDNAVRSLSLLSTAAAILDAQSNPAPQRHVAVVKPVAVEPQVTRRQPETGPFPVYAPNNQPLYPAMYNAFIPSLNQYVSIPITMAPPIPSPNILNASLENALNVYLNTQHPQTTQPLSPTRSYLPPQNIRPSKPQSQPTMNTQQQLRPTSDEIRTLLQTAPPIRKMEPPSKLPTETPRVKMERSPELNRPAMPASQKSILGKERLLELEKALLSTDLCDINDSSTTMPFKCSDGVWRMVKFKCIRGLWVVQTPDCATPTVYVPCDGDEISKTNIKSHQKSSERSGGKRKHGDEIGRQVDEKRLCASAPIIGSDRRCFPVREILKRTLSDPFITKSLPAPHQQFTNNEGKSVNISMIKRNSTKTSSCNLIKSLLLRKPTHAKPVTSSIHVASPTNAMQCKSVSGRQLAGNFNLPKPLTKNVMVY